MLAVAGLLSTPPCKEALTPRLWQASHKHSASSTPHLDRHMGAGNQMPTKSFTNWFQSGVYPPSTGLCWHLSVTGTPWFMHTPLTPLVTGQDTDTASHIVAISDRQQVAPAKTHAHSALWERGRCFLGSLTTALGNVIESQPFPDFFPKGFPFPQLCAWLPGPRRTI